MLFKMQSVPNTQVRVITMLLESDNEYELFAELFGANYSVARAALADAYAHNSPEKVEELSAHLNRCFKEMLYATQNRS